MYKSKAMSSSYHIKLPQFEGPFDLLLFFIERDELDIYDIPIAKITDDFLHYIREMNALNIDLASEFILVAATLCRIKAKLLLPRKPVDEEGNEIDPREELVQRLIEYKRYKAILDEMRALEEKRGQQFERGNVSLELRALANKALADIELEQINLYKLLRTFERLMREQEGAANKQVHQIVTWNYTIEQQQEYLYSRVKNGKRASFKNIFKACKNRIHAIVTFLAMLELLNLQRLRITAGEGINTFWLEMGESPEEDQEMPDFV